jgi:hypothetical protein
MVFLYVAPLTAPAAIYQYDRPAPIPKTAPPKDRYLQKRCYDYRRMESNEDIKHIQERYSG